MAMLETRKLTMRFGGLTAVNAVDLRVENEHIFSVIGPNGAGKTTLFNAVTGIYEPTEGSVEFGGHSLRKPLTMRVLIGCAAVGLLTGLVASLLSVNVDKLWRASIIRTAVGTSEKFTYARAFAGALGYLFNDLVVERKPRSSKWRVVASDDSEALAVVDTELEAQAARDRLTGLRKGPGAPKVVEADGGNWEVRDPDGRQIISTWDTKAEAEGLVVQLATSLSRGKERARTAVFALFGGLVLGAFSTLAVWNRARRTADGIALGGIARTFQNIRLFQNMTVLENVLIGMNRSYKSGLLWTVLRMPWATREEEGHRRTAMELLDFFGLAGKAGYLAKNLPYGEQRRLEIARAMACQPRLLLLDEPAAGMNPRETSDLMALIRRIRDRGITILLIEHHMNLVMGISDRIAVLDYGVKIAEGAPEQVKNDPKVIEAYLGKEEVS